MTYALNLAGRANQYDLWPGIPLLAHRGDDVIVVLDDLGDEVHPVIAHLGTHFQSVERGALVPLTRSDGDVVSRRRLWVLRCGWRGGWSDGEAKAR